MIRLVALAAGVSLALGLAQPDREAPVRGITAAAAVAAAYDTILDADFAGLPKRLAATCGPAPPEACHMLDALASWWQIALDPESRVLDARFVQQAERAIAENAAWTRREPARAEAWFYLGAAYGARAQWRVLRGERLSAARDGKRIKQVLERALSIDPDLHDANFGLGMYRYYADVAPATMRLLRWLLLLPGGDRRDGLRQMTDARDHGRLVSDEADYQLHLIYLWYEQRAPEALTLVKGLQARHPQNPLFHHIEAEIHDEYFHDVHASLAASAHLLALAEAGSVNDAAAAAVRARLNIAVQLDRLGDRAHALDLLTALVHERPARPHGAHARAAALLDAWQRPRR